MSCEPPRQRAKGDVIYRHKSIKIVDGNGNLVFHVKGNCTYDRYKHQISIYCYVRPLFALNHEIYINKNRRLIVSEYLSKVQYPDHLAPNKKVQKKELKKPP